MSPPSTMTSNSNPEILARAREQLYKCSLQNVQGINHISLFGSDMNEMFEHIRKTEMRPTDVINIVHPRSGNHWFLEIVQMLLTNDTTYAEGALGERLMESLIVSLEEKERRYATRADPRLFSTHFRASRAPAQIVEKNSRIVYVVRNPKDVMCSYFKLLSSIKIEKGRFQGSWEDFFELSLTGEVPWGSWFDHVLDMEKFIKDHPSVPVYIAQYEKFRADPETEIRKLARFLGQPEDKISEIVKATELKTMKEGVDAKMNEIAQNFFKESTHSLIVKGIIGGWKKQFTVDMNERYDREFEERMNGSWIGDLVRDYIKA